MCNVVRGKRERERGDCRDTLGSHYTAFDFLIERTVRRQWVEQKHMAWRTRQRRI
jgi:hypothetical protein